MNGPRWFPTMLLISIFQIITFYQVIFKADGTLNTAAGIVFIAFTAIEWLWSVISTIKLRKSSLALEYIAFFLTGISLVVNASVGTAQLIKQFIAVVLGFAAFVILLFIVADVERAEKFRKPFAAASIVMLLVTLIFARNINGAYNWLSFGGFSIQTSELVKVTFVFVGAATLEQLQSRRSLTQYVIFAVICIGMLFLMRDLGTALIFFFTFVVLAFMRSGDVRTILFLILGAAMLAGLVVLMRSDYIMQRFATYRHVWDFSNGKGYQQTRVLTYSVSGGFLGLGIGNGHLRDVFAATEDLIFGVLCEEWGMLIAFLVADAFIFIFIHSIRCAKGARSAFYSISCCAAGGLLLFQAALNIFGVTDFLPMTGVTLPFVSRGGSSTISCWALLAFIKAADNRTWAGGKR
ncbi:MAG: FtsW/RodA/SpoVE family cell cycle protein [Clostridia bacterium]|nr:FtsW/RodA/SpoVE family cell cycle protein [Clostridia bacterium]MBQ2092472.1 FtsW/RodA/SpoVE family cell cycle protein [Clostridia bacterium]MBQ3898067.1 FtsW/RodA/SpoVE family cell cycle protein [Clostridia bacterium]